MFFLPCSENSNSRADRQIRNVALDLSFSDPIPGIEFSKKMLKSLVWAGVVWSETNIKPFVVSDPVRPQSTQYILRNLPLVRSVCLRLPDGRSSFSVGVFPNDLMRTAFPPHGDSTIEGYQNQNFEMIEWGSNIPPLAPSFGWQASFFSFFSFFWSEALVFLGVALELVARLAFPLPSQSLDGRGRVTRGS